MSNALYSDTTISSTMFTSIYSIGRGENVKYTYDGIGRISNKTLYTDSMKKIDNYSYLDGYNGSTTTLVSGVNEVIKDNDNNELSNVTTSYTYNNSNYISSITYNNGTVISYTYDNLGQLKTETNSSTNRRITYNYSGIGNISTIVTEDITDINNPVILDTKAYTYSTTWQDQLVSYDGYDITYDSIGNPLTVTKNNTTYYSYEFEKGRQLKSMYIYKGYLNQNDLNATYTYNDDGIRLSKTVSDGTNSVTTKYTFADNKILYETNGMDIIHYTYDAESNLIGLTLNGTTYYYERNAINDIIGIVDGNGNKIVSYEYDSYGKLLNMTDTSGNNIGIKNPFRYKGYYYDEESGYYYLNARYYDPNMKRFINADDEGVLELDQGNIVENNLYTYALNNPINYIDENGNIAQVVAVAALVAIGALDAYTVYQAVKNPTLFNIICAGTVVAGGIIGAIKYGPSIIKGGLKWLSKFGLFKSGKYTLPKQLIISSNKLQHEWKHAGDFEIFGKWNKANGLEFEKAIRNHIKNSTNVYKSKYYQEEIFVYYNSKTGNAVYTDLRGNFISCWKLSENQIAYHLKYGVKIK